MKRRELKPGDKVRVNGFDHTGYFWQGIVGVVTGSDSNIPDAYCVDVKVGGVIYKCKVHRNQCTPIRVVKKKRREWWVNTKVYGFDSMFGAETGVMCSLTEPDNTDGWICLREVKKK